MTRIFILSIVIGLFSCNNPIADKNTVEYKSHEKVIVPQKNEIYNLPEELNEISGITFLNDSVLVAIQDEEGKLYYYNINQNRIIKIQAFGEDGDYEDLVKAGNDLYIINSEGVITHIKDFESSNPSIQSFPTPFDKKNDIESLAYDAKNNRLLIAPKEHGLTKDETTKHVYGFDLKTRNFHITPLFTIDLSKIESQFQGDALEETSKKFLKALGNKNMNKVFRTSALTVNENTGEIYMLSSINGLILILSPKGLINKIIQFAGPEYKQPEGIAFSPNGSLYISNEGDKSGIGNIIKIIHEN